MGVATRVTISQPRSRVTNHTAANHVESGVWERWKIVPAATEVFKEHSTHIRSPRSTCQNPPQPQFGHEKPFGQRSPARYSRQAWSSGNQDRNSWYVLAAAATLAAKLPATLAAMSAGDLDSWRAARASRVPGHSP